MRVLIVEDEAQLRSSLRQGLREGGFSLDDCGSGRAALELALSNPYDAVVLDLMLPDLAGLDVLAELRRQGCRTPVLILTARGGLHDRVRGLDAGADDYLAKPFAFVELLARLRALLRRGATEPRIVEVSDLRIDLIGRRVERAGRAVELTSKEFSLLECLAVNAGQVVTRSMIAERVWGLHFDSAENLIDVYIRYLRRKLDEPFGQKLIHTHRRIGYSLGRPG